MGNVEREREQKIRRDRVKEYYKEKAEERKRDREKNWEGIKLESEKRERNKDKWEWDRKIQWKIENQVNKNDADQKTVIRRKFYKEIEISYLFQLSKSNDHFITILASWPVVIFPVQI